MNQDEGGFLVPNMIAVNNPGLLAKIYRWTGQILNSAYLYKKGTRDVDFRASLMKMLKEKET